MKKEFNLVLSMTTPNSSAAEIAREYALRVCKIASTALVQQYQLNEAERVVLEAAARIAALSQPSGSPSAGADTIQPVSDWLGILDTIHDLANHGIPSYAYGDNEAACDMASRLDKIGDELRCLRALMDSGAVEALAHGGVALLDRWKRGEDVQDALAHHLRKCITALAAQPKKGAEPPREKCSDGECGKYRNFRGGCDLCGAPCL